jgi:hypothetical protein
LKAEDIEKALIAFYREPEWYLGFEVGNSCGCEVKRHADAIAINAYPSRSFETRGFEIKVSRSDLQRELNESAKAEEIYGFTNYWFLVVPKGLTKDMAIPETWGVIEFDGEKLRQKKQATFHESTITKGFMIAFIRGRQRADARNKAVEREELKQEVIREVQYLSSYNEKEYNKIKEKLEILRKETGFTVDSWADDTRNIQALKIAKTLTNDSLRRGKSDIDYHIGELAKVGDTLKNAYAEFAKLAGVDVKESDDNG